MKKYIIKLSCLLVVLGSISFSSCSLDSKQSNTIDNNEKPISTIADLEAGVIGTYGLMTSDRYYGRNIIGYSESRTEYSYSTGATERFDKVAGFNLMTDDLYVGSTWEHIYKVISNCNRVLEANLATDKGIVDHLKGQSYVLRALAHYDLLRLFGEQYVDGAGLSALGVPYITKFAEMIKDVKRPAVAMNKEQIFADLEKGIALLKVAEESGNIPYTRVQLNLASAYAFKSRIALFFTHYDTRMYNTVVEAAELAIAEGTKQGVSVATREVYLGTYRTDEVASNSLFELVQSGVHNLGRNSLFHIYNVLESGQGYGDIVYKGTVEDLFESEEGGYTVEDIRSEIIKRDYMGQLRNTGKYVALTSNIKVLRIEEVMFNYVEAVIKGASNGDKGLALNYLNDIVSKRVLLKKSGEEYGNKTPKIYDRLDMEDLKLERKKELMFEGTGYEDLMRWEGVVRNPKTEANPKLKNKEMRYGDAQGAFPIPFTEINVSHIEQNKAYR